MTTTPSPDTGGEPDQQATGPRAEQGTQAPPDDTPGAELGITEDGSTFEPEEDAQAEE